MAAHRGDDFKVTCGLTACTPANMIIFIRLIIRSSSISVSSNIDDIV